MKRLVGGYGFFEPEVEDVVIALGPSLPYYSLFK